jgi:segregation and condensation protein A
MIGVFKSGCTLKVKNFEGPLDLLLELIHESKLDITEVSLSGVTDQYLMYLKSLQFFNIDIASEFFVVAASLVFIKTKRMLTGGAVEEEEIFDEQELIDKLKEYKKFRWLSRFLWRKKEEGDIYFSKGYTADPIGNAQAFSDDVHYVGDLIRVLVRYRGAFIKKAIPIKRREVNVEQKMTKIMNKLKEKEMIKFSEAAENENTKVDKVATFLGSLELSFRQQVMLRQLEIFADFDIMRRHEQLLEESQV